jgi:hypothetical protein
MPLCVHALRRVAPFLSAVGFQSSSAGSKFKGEGDLVCASSIDRTTREYKLLGVLTIPRTCKNGAAAESHGTKLNFSDGACQGVRTIYMHG